MQSSLWNVQFVLPLLILKYLAQDVKKKKKKWVYVAARLIGRVTDQSHLGEVEFYKEKWKLVKM